MSETELRGGRYVVVRTLGEGTQGETFEAVDKREGRLVAIKRFRVGKARAWKDVELAEREAATLASLEHALLPRYVEHFEEAGALLLVMERIEGQSLAALRKQGFRATPQDVRRFLEDASRALDYLHGRAPPVVHRDLKPGNVIRRPDGSFAFVDFGAVRDRLKPAGGSTVVGTFGYMAPEQFQGRASPASDVYGIGATTLAMLTGEEPEDLPHRGLGIDVDAALPKTTPRSLVRTLEAMLEPDPERRASSIREALERAGATDEREGRAHRPGPGKKEARRAKHRARKEARDARKAARRARREQSPRGGAPSVAFRALIGLVTLPAGLLLAVVLGAAVPLVLLVLSLVFGARLRRAAAECRASSLTILRAQVRVLLALGTLTVARRVPEPTDAPAPAPPEPRASARPPLQVRVISPEEAAAEAIREDNERLGGESPDAWAERWATEQSERWEPPDTWVAAEEAAKKKRRKLGDPRS